MNAAQRNIIVKLNTDFIWNLTLLNKDKTPVDLTGSSVKMQIRDAPGGGSLYLELSTSNGLISGPLGPTGEISILVPQATVGVMTWAEGTYDVILTDSTGSLSALIEGIAMTQQGTTVP